MRYLLTTLLFVITIHFCWAQTTYPQDAVSDERDGHYAFVNATVIVSPTSKIENATLVIKNGKIASVGARIPVPSGAVQIDLKGKYIYPSFIDLYSDYGMPEAKSVGERPRQLPQEHSNKKGAFSWNEALKPEFNAQEVFAKDDKASETLRKSGFGTVLSHQHDGISRGSSTLVCLGDEKENELVLIGKASNHFSFNKGKSTQNYPSSLMGAIALIRQTYFDAEWYTSQRGNLEYNISLDSWNKLQSLPQVFEVRDWLEALRASKIGKEFGKTYIFKGTGDEYKRVSDLKATGSAFIIPLDFPVAHDVEDPLDALLVSLKDMKHWELAPGNAAALTKAGIQIAFTADGLKKTDQFLANIRKAVENGLSEEAALAAMTSTPAQMIGASNLVGTLEAGKLANFIITSESLFEKKSKILQNWIKGKPFMFEDLDKTDLRGKYVMTVGRQRYDVKVKGDANSPKITYAKNDSTDIKVSHSLKGNVISLSFEDRSEKLVRLTGLVKDNNWSGQAALSDGSWAGWTAKYSGKIEKEEEKEKDEDKDKDEDEDEDKDEKKNEGSKNKGKKEKVETGKVVYPFAAYGSESVPVSKTYLFRNATVWTNETDGILTNTDVLVTNGKISKIGKNLADKGAVTIDATGKHLTSGIIDEHSHIAISRGVNEGTQNSSAEVSIADVINSEDVNIYRALAGGVTAAQLLHGSANPIGGQSGIIKLRWGYTPENMKIKGADPFIKFALGENVKQSNWGDNYRSRFPQSRMGVEQVYFDNFTKAKEYGVEKRSGKPYRKDIELETLLQIIESKRFITCHSYVQSEINMLMKTAEAFGFRINTFTHILEGYKLADKMKAHGAGGSTFSDWWAYKFEVIDAIPHNAGIMHDEDVVVAINSDSPEMGRRLNQEAAKSVKYTGMSEEDAWKLVTLNPAKLLHIDHRTGSIKAGKDADLVLWTDNPLSIYAKAERTFVDGIQFYSIDDDTAKRKQLNSERARLITKMIEDKKKGGKTQPAGGKKVRIYHCDTIADELRD